MEAEKRGTKVLKNGAVYDLDRGRIVANPGGGNSAFSSDTAGLAVQQRIARKRDTIAAAANAAVERGDWRALHGSDAWIAAIADTAMLKATTPDDPKAIDAARFLLQEAGLSEAKQADAGAGAALGAVADVLRSIAAFARALPADVIEVSADNVDADAKEV